MSRMQQWTVDFTIEPGGREATLSVEAVTSKEAMIAAVTDLELGAGEMLHTVFAHIGPPRETPAAER
jgi:hypothetical protein